MFSISNIYSLRGTALFILFFVYSRNDTQTLAGRYSPRVVIPNLVKAVRQVLRLAEKNVYSAQLLGRCLLDKMQGRRVLASQEIALLVCQQSMTPNFGYAPTRGGNKVGNFYKLCGIKFKCNRRSHIRNIYQVVKQSTITDTETKIWSYHTLTYNQSQRHIVTNIFII